VEESQGKKISSSLIFAPLPTLVRIIDPGKKQNCKVLAQMEKIIPNLSQNQNHNLHYISIYVIYLFFSQK